LVVAVPPPLTAVTEAVLVADGSFGFPEKALDGLITAVSPRESPRVILDLAAELDA